MPEPVYDVTSDDVLELRVVGSLAGQRTINVFHYYPYALIGTANGFEVINSLNDKINVSLADQFIDLFTKCCAGDFSVNSLQYQWIYNVRYAAVTRPPAIGNGQIEGAALPPNIASSITLRTQFGVRHMTGRKQMPGVPIGAVVDGVITEALYAPLAEFAGYCVADIELTTPAVTLRPFLLKRSTPILKNWYTDFAVQDTVRDQRTRTVGKGV